ncbi:GRF1-interacting factor 1-like isoform X1 [Ananas comosus]|uniref:GRF1-interacting factor 1-like isoform X1 n=1 Tax=Ananas comosus TaxID=4615 RepID=A0A6P5EER2_ANACO|nr:GRF1-interacting factor 1-like isoform X1 [Ananas comosus]XP_020080133.1 GRF1-interacting factor 1-like isoform X1 [Ananas comosus]
MQQHLMQMNQNMMGGYASPTTVTTDLIQQYLDQNKQLILAILDNQNTGKVEECARNQAKLQHNLMYLAAIADSQPPQASAMAQMDGDGGFAFVQWVRDVCTQRMDDLHNFFKKKGNF